MFVWFDNLRLKEGKLSLRQGILTRNDGNRNRLLEVSRTTISHDCVNQRENTEKESTNKEYPNIVIKM